MRQTGKRHFSCIPIKKRGLTVCRSRCWTSSSDWKVQRLRAKPFQIPVCGGPSCCKMSQVLCLRKCENFEHIKRNCHSKQLLRKRRKALYFVHAVNVYFWGCLYLTAVRHEDFLSPVLEYCVCRLTILDTRNFALSGSNFTL